MEIFVPRAYCSMSANFALKMSSSHSGPSQNSAVCGKVCSGTRLSNVPSFEEDIHSKPVGDRNMASADPEKDVGGRGLQLGEEQMADDVVGNGTREPAEDSRILVTTTCSQEKQSSTSTVNLHIDCFTNSPSTQLYISSDEDEDDTLVSIGDEPRVVEVRMYWTPLLLAG